MLKVRGSWYCAKCISCSTSKAFWVRNDEGEWVTIFLGDIADYVLGGIIPSGTNDLYTIPKIREAVNKMGNIFCPNCMPQMKAHLAELIAKRLENQEEVFRKLKN